jgi:hypothetical protein
MKVDSNLISKLVRAFVFAGVFGGTNGSDAMENQVPVNRCPRVSSAQIPDHQPFLLKDPRSGLMLYLESDQRHMAAIARDGKIAWHRNVFDDRRWEYFYPPKFQIPGEPLISDEKYNRNRRAYIESLYVNQMSVASDCEAHLIDYGDTPLQGHYIRIGPGFLDAKTGDVIPGPRS